MLRDRERGRAVAQLLQRGGVFVLQVVRRIQEHDAGRQRSSVTSTVPARTVARRSTPSDRQILANRLQRAPVALQEEGVRARRGSAPRSDRARAGVGIDETAPSMRGAGC